MSSQDIPPAIQVEGLVKLFGARRRSQGGTLAIDDVNFSVPTGTTFGIVGESGSGKSTVARALVGLIPVDAGRITVLGLNVTAASAKEMRRARRDIQIVFQEPYESLDPLVRVGPAIGEPLVVNKMLGPGAELDARVRGLMQQVSLDPAFFDRFPHELSGGQQQRVNIARALATDPKVLVLDEPTSSLDVSVRADILQLLKRIQRARHLTYVLISHDLPTIGFLCDQVGVMYLGRLLETGKTADVLERPVHPYTKFLLGADLSLDPDERPEPSQARNGVDQRDAKGCVFTGRCPVRIDPCLEQRPVLSLVETGHAVACLIGEGAPVPAGSAAPTTPPLPGTA